MRVESRVTSLSWIPSEAAKGMLGAGFKMHVAEYDDPPPDVIDDAEVQRDGYHLRFANRLLGWAEFDGDRVVDHGVDGDVIMGRSGVKMGPIATSFAAVGMPPLRPEPEIGDGWIRFTQTCGGRTAAPLPRRIPRPPYVRMQSPLVWTTLTLTLHAGGRAEPGMAGASLFPRHWVYDGDNRLALKAPITDQAAWTAQPSQQNTPWGNEDSPVLVTAAETALERELSSVIMRGGAKPTVRELPEGAVLTKQGEPGDALYLLLDGVLSVDVDGTTLTELGPGVVLGERAVLEGGHRTATLTAVTKIRVAEAAAETIDKPALQRLSAGHRREEQRA
jgi:hypothetical protein